MKNSLNSLSEKITSRKARVGVIGLGYVGLPLATAFAEAGFSVTGFDLDAKKLKSLAKGISYIGDIETDRIKPLVTRGALKATADFSRCKDMDAIIICVPTPLRKTKDPDISFIASAAEKIAAHLHKGQLIVLESTTYPGTTREFVLPKLAQTGLKVGQDFYLAFSPERIDPGNPTYRLENTPKIVGGITSACTRAAEALYGSVVEQTIPVSSAESAEMIKLLENTFRAVNIGLVNEIALICDKLKLNVWEVIGAAATKPYGFMPFYPGPGLGGHCIPVDPHYLSWKMKSLNFTARFIELAGDVNSQMPEYAMRKATAILNQRGKAMKGAKILLMGMAYKPNVSDVRESPALDLAHLLLEQGATLAYHDPYIPTADVGHRTLKSRPYSTALLRGMDLVIITTGHQTFDAKEIVRHSRLVFDTRNVCKGIRASHIVPL